DREEPAWAPEDERFVPPAAPSDDDMRQIDTRPPPRASDYLDNGRGRAARGDGDGGSNDNAYRDMPDQPVRRPISEPRDDYRVNAPAPAPRSRKIVEEPLPY
ncbi:MAG: hypothetical protein ABI080_03530, partial [Candidatus Binatia bacterium]